MIIKGCHKTLKRNHKSLIKWPNQKLKHMEWMDNEMAKYHRESQNATTDDSLEWRAFLCVFWLCWFPYFGSSFSTNKITYPLNSFAFNTNIVRQK